MAFDLEQTDKLLTTTRAVRKRLDLERPVPREVVLECIALSQQAPTGSNTQGWRWVVVSDPGKRKALAELYHAVANDYLNSGAITEAAQTNAQTKRVLDSALYLLDHLHEVPVHVIPCLQGSLPAGTPWRASGGFWGSIYPAVWSFQLALRSRGLGTVLTTLHLGREKEAAELLDIPSEVTQAGLLPVAYTKGDEFKPVARPAPETITYWDRWGGA